MPFVATRKSVAKMSRSAAKSWRNRRVRAARLRGIHEYWESRRSTSHRKALSRAMKKYHRYEA